MPDPDRLNRCQGNTKYQQCVKDALPGSKYCFLHDPKAEDNERNMYRLTSQKDRERYQHYLESEDAYSLQSQIALQEALVEERMEESADNPIERLASLKMIADCNLSIEKLKKSHFDMQKKSGALLSKATLFAVAKKFSDIVVEELTDVPNGLEYIDRIIARYEEMINNAKDED